MRTILPITLALAACAPAEQAPNECELAEAAVAECAGADVASPFSAACDTSEANTAERILREIETGGCDGSNLGKADGPFCRLWDPFGWCDEPAAPLGDEPEGEAVRYPIVLAHGFNTSTTNFWRFNDVDLALGADGHRVVLGSAPPFDASSTRATFLAEQVDALLEEGAEKVNLVCFSQGGVDCRYLVSPDGLAYGEHVASVTTISSPHRGTRVADVALAALPEDGSRSGRIVDTLVGWYGRTFSELAEDTRFIAAMESMSEAGMVAFNRAVRDDPDVYYQSWAGFSYVAGLANPRETIQEVCRDEYGELQLPSEARDIMDPLLVAGAAFVAHGTELRPNDGVTLVTSAKWGRFRGCIPADHLDQVGQIGDEGPDRRTGFDYIRFYRQIAFELAAMGY